MNQSYHHPCGSSPLLLISSVFRYSYFCVHTEWRASKAVCAHAELNLDSDRKNYMLHSWKLSERRWCWGARSVASLHGWCRLPPFQKEANPRSQTRHQEVKQIQGTQLNLLSSAYILYSCSMCQLWDWLGCTINLNSNWMATWWYLC